MILLHKSNFFTLILHPLKAVLLYNEPFSIFYASYSESLNWDPVINYYFDTLTSIFCK